ncbi:hypothetical protein D3C76_1776270 [compost metagenome]
MGGRDKFAQGRNRLRHPHAAADIEHRFLRVGQHLAGFADFGKRERIVILNGGEVRLQIAQRNLNIFWDINQNRARTA